MMTSSVVSLCKIIILLLSLINVHGFIQQQYDQPFYFDYGSLNSQSSTSYNSGTKIVPRIAWGWPFNQQNVVKAMKNPPFISKENENNMPQNDKFIFPEVEPMRNTEQKPHKVISRIGEAPACQGKTFCEDVPNYPTNLLNNVIKNSNFENYESIDAMDITFRIFPDSTESLCLSTEQVVYPKSAETVNGQWLFVVNHPNFTQGVRVETCMKEGEKCSIIAGFAEGYSTTCAQKYIYRQLAAIDEKGSFTQDLFRFPASCCCHVRFLGTSLRSRLRGSITSSKTQKIQTMQNTQKAQSDIDTD